jgi:hypothetical protein
MRERTLSQLRVQKPEPRLARVLDRLARGRHDGGDCGPLQTNREGQAARIPVQLRLMVPKK